MAAAAGPHLPSSSVARPHPVKSSLNPSRKVHYTIPEHGLRRNAVDPEEPCTRNLESFDSADPQLRSREMTSVGGMRPGVSAKGWKGVYTTSGTLPSLRNMFRRNNPFKVHGSQRRPLEQWRMSALVYTHWLQERADVRLGSTQLLAFFAYSVLFFLHMIPSFDKWGTYHTNAALADQLMGNLFSFEMQKNVHKISVTSELFLWLKNVWAPALFPLLNSTTAGEVLSAEALAHAGALHNGPGHHYFLGKSLVVGEPTIGQVRCKFVQCDNVERWPNPKRLCRDDEVFVDEPFLDRYGRSGDEGGEWLFDDHHHAFISTRMRKRWRRTDQVYSLEEVTRDLEWLETSGFVDASTCQVWTRIQVKNLQYNVWGVMKLVFAIEASGHVVPVAKWEDNLAEWGSYQLGFELEPYATKKDWLRGLVYVIFCLATLVIVQRKLRAAYMFQKYGSGFGQYILNMRDNDTIWSMIDVVFYGGMVIVAIAHVCQLAMIDRSQFEGISPNHAQDINPKLIVAIGVQRVGNTVLGMVMAIKYLKYLRFFPKVNFLNITVKYIIQDLAGFITCFVLILLIYGLTAMYFFGGSLKSYNTMSRSLASISRISLGLDSYESLLFVDASFGWIAPLFWWSVIMIFYFLLMNMLIALIVGAYQSCLAGRERINEIYRAKVPAEGKLHFLMPVAYYSFFPTEHQILKQLSTEGIIEEVTTENEHVGVFGVSSHVRITYVHLPERNIDGNTKLFINCATVPISPTLEAEHGVLPIEVCVEYQFQGVAIFKKAVAYLSDGWVSMNLMCLLQSTSLDKMQLVEFFLMNVLPDGAHQGILGNFKLFYTAAHAVSESSAQHLTSIFISERGDEHLIFREMQKTWIVKQREIKGPELRDSLLRCFEHCKMSRSQWLAKLLQWAFGTTILVDQSLEDIATLWTTYAMEHFAVKVSQSEHELSRDDTAVSIRRDDSAASVRRDDSAASVSAEHDGVSAGLPVASETAKYSELEELKRMVGEMGSRLQEQNNVIAQQQKILDRLLKLSLVSVRPPSTHHHVSTPSTEELLLAATLPCPKPRPPLPQRISNTLESESSMHGLPDDSDDGEHLFLAGVGPLHRSPRSRYPPYHDGSTVQAQTNKQRQKALDPSYEISFPSNPQIHGLSNGKHDPQPPLLLTDRPAARQEATEGCGSLNGDSRPSIQTNTPSNVPSRAPSNIASIFSSTAPSTIVSDIPPNVPLRVGLATRHARPVMPDPPIERRTVSTRAMSPAELPPADTRLPRIELRSQRSASPLLCAKPDANSVEAGGLAQLPNERPPRSVMLHSQSRVV